jgi:hypothetical protein
MGLNFTTHPKILLEGLTRLNVWNSGGEFNVHSKLGAVTTSPSISKNSGDLQ